VSFFYYVIAPSSAVAEEGVMVIIQGPLPPPAVQGDLNISVPASASTNIDVLKNDEPDLTIESVTQPPAGMGRVAIGGSCGTPGVNGIPGCLVYTVGSTVPAETRVSVAAAKSLAWWSKGSQARTGQRWLRQSYS
jgi:hypothetical protein